LSRPGTEDAAAAAYWKRKAERFARHYAGAGGFSMRRAVSSFLDARARVLRRMDPWNEGVRVLDLGCGTGVHLDQLRSAWAVGLDYSAQMLELARRRLGGTTRRAKLVLGDAGHLPFADQSFDGIVCMGLLDYLAMPERALAEAHRILMADGLLICSFPKSPSVFQPLRSRIGTWIKKQVFDLPQIQNTWTRSQLESDLSDQGFRLEQVSEIWTTMWMVRAVRLADRHRQGRPELA
jgi:ubiquinone/menaquinone biosynthesis C-methylase UbiE